MTKRGLKSRHALMLALGGTIGTGLFIGSGWQLEMSLPLSWRLPSRDLAGSRGLYASFFHPLRVKDMGRLVVVTTQIQDKDGEKSTAKSIDFLGDIYVLEVRYLEPTTPDSWLCRIA